MEDLTASVNWFYIELNNQRTLPVIHFDCHAHVYDQIVAQGAVRYLPTRPAPLADWRALQDSHGLSGGVIVQVSFLGTDNSQMLAALQDLPTGRFAGVAVIDIDTPDAEIARLCAAGVRAIRWNLVAGATIPDLTSSAVQSLMRTLARHDMHLELQLESKRLAPLLPQLADLPLPVVIDHLGLPETTAAQEPWLNALDALPERENFYIKISAPYRGSAQGLDHVDRLLSLLAADRFVWGSDWPHTRHESHATYAGLLDDLKNRIDDRAAVRRLYQMRLDHA